MLTIAPVGDARGERRTNSAAMTAVIRKADDEDPKTGQPWPLTSWRERPKASKTPRRSTTITGAITAQIVSR